MKTAFDGDERIGVYYSPKQITTLPGTLAVYEWNGEGYERNGFMSGPERVEHAMGDCLGTLFTVAGEFMRQVVVPGICGRETDGADGFSQPGYVIVKAFKGVRPAYDTQLGRLMVSFSIPAILGSSRTKASDDDFKVSDGLTEMNSISLMLLFMLLASRMSATKTMEGAAL